ncbi:hypothetical protein BpHYR1_051615 [Brachionus plicatilis]|uniref:Uncharacterized protein n=1 Tax=Brachionus plicatilis TaxID=10195 RepID=A0A3M7QZA4_BRAPC|nr:hypothetical protein BpHYR1_051615 [Brachionus plicatilis]
MNWILLEAKMVLEHLISRNKRPVNQCYLNYLDTMPQYLIPKIQNFELNKYTPYFYLYEFFAILKNGIEPEMAKNHSQKLKIYDTWILVLRESW